jgi:hypothetical protein
LQKCATATTEQATTAWVRKEEAEGWKKVEDEGKKDISPPFFNPSLQVGLIQCFTYIMASIKQVRNCNGTDAVS